MADTPSGTSATSREYPGRDLEAMDFAERYHAWILDEFGSAVRGTVAEIGAGSGAFSRLLLQRPGVERLVAVEPSEAMYSILEERLGSDSRVVTHCALFHEVVDCYHDALDTLVYVNVLEHIEDDRGELRRAFEALRPGGHLCIFVPALPWLYSDFDAAIGHFRRYLRAELVEKVETAGYSVVRARYFDVGGVLPWLVAFRLLGRSLGGGQVRLYDRWVVPLLRRLEGVAPPPVGKNVLLICRKPGEVTP